MSDEFVTLSERACLRVSGDAAAGFLDNLITCKTIGLDVHEASFGALLSPQGKILFDFFLIKDRDSFLIDVDESLIGELLKRLTFYKLRAKVVIEADSDLTVAVGTGAEPSNAAIVTRDPRHKQLGFRAYGNFPSTGSDKAYQALRLTLGIPEGAKDFTYGDAYPHETLMDQFGGVDFKKGCYVGQEVVSRMQHRGTTKKRVIGVQANEPLPATDTPITADGKPAGTLGTVIGQSGLALLRLDRAAKANVLEADGVRMSTRLPDWVSFGMPEAE